MDGLQEEWRAAVLLRQQLQSPGPGSVRAAVWAPRQHPSRRWSMNFVESVNPIELNRATVTMAYCTSPRAISPSCTARCMAATFQVATLITPSTVIVALSRPPSASSEASAATHTLVPHTCRTRFYLCWFSRLATEFIACTSFGNCVGMRLHYCVHCSVFSAA